MANFWGGPAPDSTPVVVPETVFAVRSAAIAYVNTQKGAAIPFATETWQLQEVQPGDVRWDYRYYRFATGSCWLTVSHVYFPNQEPVYTVMITDKETNFDWTGQVDSQGQVWDYLPEATATQSPLIQTSDEAHQAIMSYLTIQHPDWFTTPPSNWERADITPPRLLGAKTYRYTAVTPADNWIVTVTYRVVAPELTVYRAVLQTASGNVYWNGEIDPKGVVKESQIH